MKRLIILSFLMGFIVTAGKAQMLTVKTNVALDAIKAPNLGLEMTTGNHTALSLSVFYADNPLIANDSRVSAIQPEWKYYFSGRALHSHYIGIGAIGADYKIHWKNKNYDGNAVGLGLTFGYVWNISKRWNIDFHAGLGAITYKQKEYYDGDNYEDYAIDGKELANSKGYYLLPTDFGISLAYIIR